MRKKYVEFLLEEIEKINNDEVTANIKKIFKNLVIAANILGYYYRIYN